MFAVSVVFNIREDHVEPFVELILQHSARTLAREIGCMRFDVGRDANDPTRVFVYELFVDRHAFDIHSKTDYLDEFFAAAGDWIESKQAHRWDISRGSAPNRTGTTEA